jgi:hypothetical protein
MINLPDVTLVATTSVRIAEHLRAIEICREHIDYGEVLFISHEKPENLPSDIKYIFYPEINNIMDFNHLMFSLVGQFISTSHALFCQDHAFVLNHHLWRDEWLRNDYIGSPWPVVPNAYLTDSGERVRVGNGGWSLRSRFLMNIPRLNNIPLQHRQNYWNEDGNICVYNRDKFLDLGVKYGTLKEAVRFGYENPVPENQGIISFGFHRNLPPYGWINNNYD